MEHPLQSAAFPTTTDREAAMSRIATGALAVIAALITAPVLGQQPVPPAAPGTSVGQDGKINTAVISVGGFLGIGSKLVRVPYDQLRLEERAPSETSANAPAVVAVPALDGAPTTAAGSIARDVPAGTAPGRTATVAPNATTTRVVLPGASKDSLTKMPKFDYGT
jgi:hypothetical protein